MGIWLSFVYIEQGALVARVNREYKERYDYLERQAAAVKGVSGKGRTGK